VAAASNRTMKALAAVAAVASLVLAVGCSGEGGTAGTIDGPVLTVAPANEIAVMQAILRGRLVQDASTGCLVLNQGPGLPPVIVWPTGTRWQAESSVVVLPDGVELKVGDDIEAGGGGVDPGYVEPLAGDEVVRELRRCGANASGVALIQSI
jgi:hypothetical protein